MEFNSQEWTEHVIHEQSLKVESQVLRYYSQHYDSITDSIDESCFFF